MKRKIVCTGLALLMALPILGGCAMSAKAPQVQQQDVSAYVERIAALEEALKQEREARFISDSTYERRIKELEEQLSPPTVDQETMLPTEGEALLFRYEIKDSEAIITAYNGSATLVTVPAAIAGYPVVGIGERAFESRQIAAVILPDGLKTIEWFAFYDCEKLIDVSIPSSVTSIGHAVFDGCPDLSIVCHADSYAQKYAESYGIPYIIA